MTALSSRHRVLLGTLTLGAFAIGLDAFVVIGALDEILRDLAITPVAAGWIVSSYAFCYAVFAPLNAWLFRRWNRRTVLVLSIGLFALGNLVCAVAPDYATLIAGRVGSAFGAAMFTPAATTLATELLPAERKGFALSLIFAGMTVSQAAGVPIASWIAEAHGWRYAFHFVVFFGVLAMALLAGLLARTPRVPAISPAGTAGVRRLPGAVFGLLAVTLLVVASEFAVYSYVSLLFPARGPDGVSVLPAVLLAYGVGAVAGNVATGLLTDRLGAAGVLLTAVAVQTALLVALIALRDQAAAAIGVGFLWGIVSYMYLVPIQHRLLDHAPRLSSLVLAANSSVIYVGIGTGSWIGGLALERAGLAALAGTAAAIGVAALVAAAIAMRRPVPGETAAAGTDPARAG